jgi:dihydrofolate reductase
MPVLLDMAVSLDGHVGRADGSDAGLHGWYFEPSAESRPVVDELVETTGAIVIGRGAFDLGEKYGGWDDTPYHFPHVVVTHHPPVDRPAGGVELVFVAGIEPAVARAREAAGDRWVAIGGGADVARQCLTAGLVDEVQLHVVPVVLGEGLPLFAGLGREVRLARTRVVDGPTVTHLRYRVESPAP